MDGRLLLAAAQLLICIRDARLVSHRPKLAWWWIPSGLAASAACGFLAERISADEARALLLDPRIWGLAVALHAGSGIWTAYCSRQGRQVDWVSLCPTAISCVAWTGAVRETLVRVDGVPGVLAGVAAGALCLGLSVLLARFNRGKSVENALRFSAMSHVSAVVLIPASAVLDRPIGAHPVNWPATGTVLPAVLALICLSFAWHRRRQRRTTQPK